MKLDEFAKKHAGDKVALVVLKGKLFISAAQMHQLHAFKEEYGIKFVNLRATEVLGLNHKGLKLNDLTRGQAAKIIEAVENYQHEMDSESFDTEQSAENIRNHNPEAVGDAHISNGTAYDKWRSTKTGVRIPKHGRHMDRQSAYPHQLLEINAVKQKYNLLYGVMCREAFGRTISQGDLSIEQARAVLIAGHRLANRMASKRKEKRSSALSSMKEDTS